MPEKSSSSIKRWPYVAGGVVGVFAVLYFVLTSGPFIRAIVLPKVSAALNSELTVDSISVSPFSSVEFGGIKLTPKGGETLLTAGIVRARYSLMSIIGGTIKVNEVTVESPEITLVTKADGSSNLDPITKSDGKNAPKSVPAKAAPPKLEVSNVSIHNATLHVRQAQTNGIASTVDVTGLNFGLDSLQNGGSSKITIDAKAIVNQPGRGVLGVGLGGNLTVTLSSDLMPTAISGGLKTDVSQATGTFKDLAGASINLLADATPTEIKQLDLAFLQSGNSFGKIHLSGPFNQAAKEARIDYALTGIDRRALKFALAATGLDLGDTSISATGRVDLASQGDVVASRGLWSFKNASMVVTNGATPPMDLSIDYQVSANLNDKTALLEKLAITGVRSGATLISGNVERPMNFAWGTATPGFRESTFSLKVIGLNLDEWKPFLGPSAPAGILGVGFSLAADNNGKILKGTLSVEGSHVAAKFTPYEVRNGSLKIDSSFTVEDFKDISCPKFSATISESGKQLVTVSGTASYQLPTARAGLQLSADVGLPTLVSTFPLPGVTAAAGTLRVNVQADKNGPKTDASVALLLQGFTGAYNQFTFKDYQATVNVVTSIAAESITLSRCTITPQTGLDPGGFFDVSGKYNIVAKTAAFDFKTVNLNENALRPFVAPFVAPNQLVSVSIDTAGNATWASTGKSTIHSDIKISRFFARSATGPVTEKPLEMGFAIDGAKNGSKIDLQKLQLRLGATTNARNEILISGSIDMGTNQPAPSSLAIKSDGLDLTPLADLFGGAGTTNAAVQNTGVAPATPAKGPATEPPPINLPFKKFDLSLDIAKVHLRQLDVTGWTAKVAIDNGKLSVNPFAMKVAGAPVNLTADADLSVPGYNYKTTFLATQIPLAPLVDTFVADLKGSAAGFASIDSKVDGKGITPPSLRKNLVSTLIVNTTNLVVQIPKTKVRLPIFGESDLTGTLRFVATILGVGDVLAEPVRLLHVNAITKDGKVDLAGTKVGSSAFRLEPTGGVTISDVLTNSPVKIPLAFFLGPSGSKSLLVATGPDGYGRLPDFASLGGTVGKIDTKLDKLALGELALRSAAGLPGNLGGAAANILKGAGGKAGNVLQGVGGLVSPSNSTNASSGLGGLLKGLTGGGTPTNAAGTNAAPTPGLLDLFRKK